MFDAPIRFGDALLIDGVTLAVLLACVFLWRIRLKVIRVVARVVLGAAVLYLALGFRYVYVYGIAWVGLPFGTIDRPRPEIVFSRAADFCYLAAWLSTTILSAILVRALARKAGA